MAKAMVPAPIEIKFRLTTQMADREERKRTQGTPRTVNKTFMYVVNIDCGLAAVTPYHLTCLTEVLLIVGKDN
jgi:hypothetical protein